MVFKNGGGSFLKQPSEEEVEPFIELDWDQNTNAET